MAPDMTGSSLAIKQLEKCERSTSRDHPGVPCKAPSGENDILVIEHVPLPRIQVMLIEAADFRH